MRVGLMGGTFDPIHLGHLITAEEIRDGLSLDKVIFIPSSTPPHKSASKSMIIHRKRMAMLAVCPNPLFEVSDYEVAKGGVSYTIDTILHMKKSVAEASEFFFIVGSDAFYDLFDWKGAPGQFDECNFVVATRRGESVQEKIDFLNGTVAKRFHKYRFKAQEKGGRYKRVIVEGTGNSILFFSTTRIDISSTGIRERVLSGSSINYLTPSAVCEYIKKEGLYMKGSF